jgi:hypothetical protein
MTPNASAVEFFGLAFNKEELLKIVNLFHNFHFLSLLGSICAPL